MPADGHSRSGLGPGPAADLNTWLTWLEQAHHRAWDPGLCRVARVARRLGVLAPARRVITVAGTNGKGSTVSALEHLALAAGVPVLATYSPHLFRFNERLRLNGAEVSDAGIVAAFAAIDRVRDVSLSYFEFAALAALWLAREHRVDLLLLEVGLGGRLDAFNILAADVAVVASVGVDHEAWLGADRETIGAEKAGILRAGRPLVCGETAPPASVLARAATLGCPVQLQDPDSALPMSAEAAAGLAVGADNARTALAAWCLAMAALPAETGAALQAAGLPGRCQKRRHQGIRVWLDVAHNPAAAAHLTGRLQALQAKPVVAVLGQFADKDAVGVVAALPAGIKRWFTVPVAGARGQTAEVLARRLQAQGLSAEPVVSVAQALSRATAEAGTLGGDLLICGSFATVAAALHLL